MKLLFYDDFKFGALKGDTVVDLSGAVSGIQHTSPQDLLNKVIEDFSRPPTERPAAGPGSRW